MAEKLAITKCGRCGTKFDSADAKNAHDASRDITKHEQLAMFKWSYDYAHSGQSARCFYRSLEPFRQNLVREQVAKILEARDGK